MGLKISIGKHHESPVLRVDGEIVCQESIKISKKLQLFCGSVHGEVYLDLSRATFIDSYGMGGLIYSQKVLERENVSLLILNPHENIRKVFESNNLHRIFKFVFFSEERAAS